MHLLSSGYVIPTWLCHVQMARTEEKGVDHKVRQEARDNRRTTLSLLRQPAGVP